MLVPPEAKDALDFLIENRREMHIPDTNEFLFGTPHKNSHLQGHTIIQKFAHGFELKQPKFFTSTNLRKYLATTMQVFSSLCSFFIKLTDNVSN